MKKNFIEQTILIFEECGYTKEDALNKIREIERANGFTCFDEASKIYTDYYFRHKEEPAKKVKPKTDKRINREYIPDDVLDKLIEELEEIFNKYNIRYTTLFGDYNSVARKAIKNRKVTPALYDRIRRTLNDKQLFKRLEANANKNDLVRINVNKFKQKLKEYKKANGHSTDKSVALALAKDPDFIARIFTTARGGSKVSVSRLKKLLPVIGSIEEIKGGEDSE